MSNSSKNKSYRKYLSTLSILLMASPWAYADFKVTNAPPAPFYTGTETKTTSIYPSQPLAKPLNMQAAATKSTVTAVKPKAQPTTTSSAPDYSSYLGWQINVLAGAAGLSANSGQYLVPNVFSPSSPLPTQLSGHADMASFAPGLGIAYAFNMAPHSCVRPWNTYLLQSIALGVNAYYLGGSNSGETAIAPGVYFSDSIPIGNYKTDLSSVRIMFDSELDFHPLWQRVLPFVQVGIGPAINSMSYHYTKQPGAIPSVPSFNASATQTNFAYEMGGGVKVDLMPHSQLSLRYLYSNMGDVSVSSAGNLAAPYTVSMHASSLLLGYTYAFGS